MYIFLVANLTIMLSCSQVINQNEIKRNARKPAVTKDSKDRNASSMGSESADASGENADEPVAIGGAYLTFSCYENPHSKNLTNRLNHCRVEDAKNLVMIPTIKNLIINVDSSGYKVTASDSLIFQWDLWLTQSQQIGNVRVEPDMTAAPVNLGIELKKTIQEMPPVLAKAIASLDNLYTQKDQNIAYPENANTPSLSKLQELNFFMANEPNIGPQSPACLTISNTEGQIGWTDEDCSLELDYPFACQSNENALVWKISDRTGNPSELGPGESACETGYHWDFPKNNNENEALKTTSKSFKEQSQWVNAIIWLNLRLTGESTNLIEEN